MLEYLEPFIENTSPRIIPAWQQYVSAIETYRSPLYKRYLLAADVSTPGVSLLRYILSCVDWSYMRHQSSDYDRYMFHIRYIRDDLENTFDHITTGFRFFNCFTTKHMGKVQEIVIPVEDTTAISTLPFDRGWEDWIGIRPVRYLYHDSSELSFDIEKDRVRFYREPPSYVVVSIDVVALVFKYWKYLTDAPTPEEDVGKDTRRFLHKYVFNGFFYDQLDTYLIHQLVDISKIQAPDEIAHMTSRTKTSNLQYGWVGSRYTESCSVMYKELQKIKSGNIRPSAILSSPILGNRRSIVQRVHTLCNTLDVPRLRQYQFYRYLRDKDLFQFILSLHQYKSQEAVYKRIERTVKPKIQRLLRERIWTYMKDPVLRSRIQDELEDLNSRLSYA